MPAVSELYGVNVDRDRRDELGLHIPPQRLRRTGPPVLEPLEELESPPPRRCREM